MNKFNEIMLRLSVGLLGCIILWIFFNLDVSFNISVKFTGTVFGHPVENLWK